MGNKINLPPNDEFLINYNQFIFKERELKCVINDLYALAETLKLESYNKKYENIKRIDNEIKFLYNQMEKNVIDKNNQNHEFYKKQKLVEVKKKYLSLIEDYMKIPIKIFSALKLEIR